LPASELTPIGSLRAAVAERVYQDWPSISPDSLISKKEAGRYLANYASELLKRESGELSLLDEQVTKSLAEGDLISANVEKELESRRTAGEGVADVISAFGGSWKFILSCLGALIAWIVFNLVSGKSFDPYPFILLNLVLSCVAALQAPIIMMSQRRQETKDRMRSLNDYRVNLKAELEIRNLHEKVDHLLFHQWQRLSEIQELQIELLRTR
jgi:uncharacterized membrane protein